MPRHHSKNENNSTSLATNTYLSQLPPQFRHLIAQDVKSSKNKDKGGERPLKRKKKRMKKSSELIKSEDEANGKDEGQAIMNVRLHDEEGRHLISPRKHKAKLSGDVPVKIPIMKNMDDKKTIVIISDDEEPEENAKIKKEKDVIDQLCQDDEEDEGEDDDFDDFEDVDLDNYIPELPKTSPPSKETDQDKHEIINLAPSNTLTDDDKSINDKTAKKKVNVISKEERQFRQDFHRIQLTVMMTHGRIRNEWCNDMQLQIQLKQKLSIDRVKVETLLRGENGIMKTGVYTAGTAPVSTQIQSRRFLDGIKMLLNLWQKNYKICSLKGLYRNDWHEWPQNMNKKPSKPVTFERFKRSIVTKCRGDRDIGVQGFVILLRSYGIRTRLCYSIQVGDYTDSKIKERMTEQLQTSQETSEEVNLSCTRNRILTAQEKINQLRKAQIEKRPASSDMKNPSMDLIYPVFWAETWNPFVKRWITVSPHLLVTIEDIINKSQLEPPPTYHYNQLRYVVAYDNEGYVRDVTQRYAAKYHTKTRKKRITRDIQGEIWFDQLLLAVSKPGQLKADELEAKWFAEKSAREGMPDSIADYKTHPFYALERDIKSNEILRKGSKPCGYIRTRGKNQSLSVYKREDIVALKTARGWYQKGMVLKEGERPMKTKPKPPHQIVDGDNEVEDRLYSAEQVQLYVPPAVSDDGIITKNSFGNLDIFTPSMIPKGGVLLQQPFITQAVKALGIDYAPAVTGFKFERGRKANAQITGVVVWESLKEACESVAEQLESEAQEKARCERELRAMRGWWVVLNKLRIKKRLEKRFGKVKDIEDGVDFDHKDKEEKELEKDYQEYLNEIDYGGENEESSGNVQRYLDGFDLEDEKSMSEREEGDSNEEDYNDGGGGFFPNPELRSHKRSRGNFNDDDNENTGNSGGFEVDSTYRYTTSSRRDKAQVDYKQYYESEDDVQDDFHEEHHGENHQDLSDTAGGFMLEDHERHEAQEDEKSEDDQNNLILTQEEANELDEYEDFFNQLENMDQENEQEQFRNEVDSEDALGGGFDVSDIQEFKQEGEKGKVETHINSGVEEDKCLMYQDFQPVGNGDISGQRVIEEQLQEEESKEMQKSDKDHTVDEESSISEIDDFSPLPNIKSKSRSPSLNSSSRIELPKLPKKTLNYDEDLDKEFNLQLVQEERQKSLTPGSLVLSDIEDTEMQDETVESSRLEELQDDSDEIYDEFEYDSE